MTGAAGNPPADNPLRAAIVGALGQRPDLPLDTSASLRRYGTTLVEAAEGQVSVRFKAGRDTLQDNGVVSGGDVGAMLDSAMAIAVLSTLGAGQTCATVSYTVNLMRAAGPGDLAADASVDRLGKRIAFASARLTDERGRVVAAATSSFAVLDMATHGPS